MSEPTARQAFGCAAAVAAFPAACIWWVLFGLMLNKTQAGAMEWSLYVGYLVMSVIAFCLGSFMKLLEDKP